MKEAEKPDGYVAWHPTEMIDEVTLYPLAGECRAMLLGYVYPSSHKSRSDAAKDPEWKRAYRQGWKIRPVKLQFLDEEK